MKQIKFNGDFYFLISKKENLKIQTINECNKLIIEEPENPFLSKFETNYGINDICFCSTSLLLFFDIENINKIISKLIKNGLSKLKLSCYLTNNKSLNFLLPNYLDKLSIHNLLYPSFNIFNSIQGCNINNFKLKNYKFTSNSHLNEFFNFIIRSGIKNLILKDIFIEILEINDSSNEYGIIKSYFDYQGNNIMIYKNNDFIKTDIESLKLSNCRLININFGKFSTLGDTKLSISIENNSILYENDDCDSILGFKNINNKISIIIDCQFQINKNVLNFIKNYSIEKIKFINGQNLFQGENFFLSCRNLKFQYCSYDFVNQIVQINTNNIENLSIKDLIGEKKSLTNIDNSKLFSEGNINISMSDSKVEIPQRKYNTLKISYYTHEKGDLKNYIKYLNSLISLGHKTLILKGNIFYLIQKNIKFNSENIVLNNIISDESIEKEIKNLVEDKNISFFQCSFFFCGKMITNLDYNTFNNIIFVNNEINDLSHFINYSIFDNDKKFSVKYNTIFKIIQPFYINKIIFHVNNQIEFRNIVLTLIIFYKDYQKDFINELKDNFIINKGKIKHLSKYDFTNEQIEFINNLKIRFIFNKKKNNFN